MVRAYREADILRQERENSKCWLMGRYVYDAISRLTPVLHAFAKNGTQPVQYLDAPYELEVSKHKKKTPEQEAKEKEQEALRAYAYMSQFIEAGKNWGKNKKTNQKTKQK